MFKMMLMIDFMLVEKLMQYTHTGEVMKQQQQDMKVV
jgi:hypothetical protein